MVTHKQANIYIMYCTNVSDVTLSVYPHWAGWKVCLTMVGIEPATFSRAKVLSYKVKSVRVCGISELSLVWPSIPMCSYDHDILGRWFDSQRSQANYSACLVWIYTHSNRRNIIFTWVQNIKTHPKISWS
jgi:hypothetical protein